MQEAPMALEDRIPEMTEKELENLEANAMRIAKAGASKQQAEAERLLPIIAAALVARRQSKAVDMAEKKAERQKQLAEARAKKAAARKQAGEP